MISGKVLTIITIFSSSGFQGDKSPNYCRIIIRLPILIKQELFGMCSDCALITEDADELLHVELARPGRQTQQGNARLAFRVD